MNKVIPFLLLGVLILVAFVFISYSELTVSPIRRLCTHTSTGASMTWTTARELALVSECSDEGNFKEEPVCNEDTGTWWIDLDVYRSGCNPACVIDITTGDAVINWRCTGLVD